MATAAFKSTSFPTLAIHAGEAPDPQTGALAPVLVRTKTYAQKWGHEAEFQYSRGKNPTRQQLEHKLAVLDGGQYACAFASGNAATAAFLFTLSPGDHILCCQEIYGGTYRLLDQLLHRFGISFSFADFSTAESIRAGLRSETKYLFVETPTNPSLHVIDLIVNTATTAGPIVYGESLASPETILAYPPAMSHKGLPVEVRKSLGITDGFFRLSVGFEDPTDIIHGLVAGLTAMN